MSVWIVDRYNKPVTIVAALWALYGDHAKVVLEWLLVDSIGKPS